MKSSLFLLFVLSVVVCIFTQSAFALPQQECQGKENLDNMIYSSIYRSIYVGIEVLYPKADSIIDCTDDQSSTYLIIGKYTTNNKLYTRSL
jgi:hypothetical protein